MNSTGRLSMVLSVGTFQYYGKRSIEWRFTLLVFLFVSIVSFFLYHTPARRLHRFALRLKWSHSFLCYRMGDAGDVALVRHEGRGSEGFLEHVYKHAAKELFGVDVQEITYKNLRWAIQQSQWDIVNSGSGWLPIQLWKHTHTSRIVLSPLFPWISQPTSSLMKAEQGYFLSFNV